MNLFIDTTDYISATFALSGGKKILKQTLKLNPQKSYETVGKLAGFLKKYKIKNLKSEIQTIVVNKGPGSYTGTRVGASIALALSLAWQAPVKFVGKEKFKIK